MNDVHGSGHLNGWQMRNGTLTRAAPVGLRDGTSLRSVITVFAQRAGSGGFTAQINEGQHHQTSVDELIHHMPARLTGLELRSLEHGLMMHFDALAGGHTRVKAPVDDSYPAPGSLRRLVDLVEAHKRRLGPRLLLTRSRWPWLSKLGPSLI